VNVADRPKLGSGGRFRRLVASGMSPALAHIGRKKYGAKRMAKMATAGRRRAQRSKAGSAGSY
jgi:hypothetical protein